MAKKLSRTGVIGLELTREEVIEASTLVKAIYRKAQCREVNGDIVDALDNIHKELTKLDFDITWVLDGGAL